MKFSGLINRMKITETIIDYYNKIGFKVISKSQFDSNRPELIFNKDSSVHIIVIIEQIQDINHLKTSISKLINFSINEENVYLYLASKTLLKKTYKTILNKYKIGYLQIKIKKIDPVIKASLFNLNDSISHIFENLKKSKDINSIKTNLMDVESRIKSILSYYKLRSVNLNINKNMQSHKLISDALILRLLEMKKTSYKEDIKNFVTNLNNPDKNIYELTSDTLDNLWSKKNQTENGLVMISLFKEFEPILFKDTSYRDHFLHQFQVFLLGVPIISLFREIIEKPYQSIGDNKYRFDLDYTWLLTSTFHDIGYPIQKVDSWMNTFFKAYLNIEYMPVYNNLNIDSILWNRNYMEHIDQLASIYAKRIGSDNKNSIDNFRRIILKELIEKKNHGILSAICLLDRVSNPKTNEKESINLQDKPVYNAALAIALHDKNIFLNKEIPLISFEKNPLIFLLIYSDTVQEWGRPLSSDISFYNKHTPILEGFTISKDTKEISCVIKYNNSKDNGLINPHEDYEKKSTEIKDVLAKLVSKQFKFKIELIQEGTNEPSTDFSTRRIE
jgi:ribosomal protein S15P/S13E